MNKLSLESIQYIPDFDLNSSYEEIDEFDKELSEEEDIILQEILTLEQQANVGTHFMSDLLSAVEKGAMDYIDSMTDTNDAISKHKRSGNVSQWDNVEIEPINKPATKEQEETFHPRTMSEANKSPIPNITETTTAGM